MEERAIWAHVESCTWDRPETELDDGIRNKVILLIDNMMCRYVLALKEGLICMMWQRTKVGKEPRWQSRNHLSCMIMMTVKMQGEMNRLQSFISSDDLRNKNHFKWDVQIPIWDQEQQVEILEYQRRVMNAVIRKAATWDSQSMHKTCLSGILTASRVHRLILDIDFKQRIIGMAFCMMITCNGWMSSNLIGPHRFLTLSHVVSRCPCHSPSFHCWSEYAEDAGYVSMLALKCNKSQNQDDYWETSPQWQRSIRQQY